MAKTKTTPQKKSPHGKVNPVNMGNPSEKIAKSEAGRLRKKHEQEMRERAAAAQREATQNLKHRKLTLQFDSLSRNYEAMLRGTQGKSFGLRLHKSFENHSAFGVIRMEVRICGKHNLPSIMVTGSTFDPIPESEGNFLPLVTLAHKILKDVGQPKHVLDWQMELHSALRHFLKDEIEANPPFSSKLTPPVHIVAPQLQLRPQRNADRKFEPAQVEPVVEEDSVDVTGHKPLTAIQFFQKDSVGVYTHEKDGHLAYFRLERIAGVQSFKLVAVDEGHPLMHCLGHHNTVHVHLQDLPANNRPYGALQEMRNARECVRQYLRQVGTSFGIKPKTKPGSPEQQQSAA